MGIVHGRILLSNAAKPDLKGLNLEVICDSGAIVTCIPQSVAEQLQLEQVETRVATITDGTSHRVPYVAPVKIQFDNRTSVGGALVFGEQVLLGATAVQDMDLMLDMRNEELIVPPDRPNFAVNPVL
ncbi:MAG: clan AA aspartic protease [Planctomycetota bacterium]